MKITMNTVLNSDATLFRKTKHFSLFLLDLEELRRKFIEDKKKLAIAKAARKFRPT